MANHPFYVQVTVFLLVHIVTGPSECFPCGMNVLCPEVTVETCTPPCAMTTQTGGCPAPPELTQHYPRVCCPFYPPFPFYPPPAAPSYCVQSVVVGGRDECDKKNKTAVTVKKAEPKPPTPPPPPPPPPYHHPLPYHHHPLAHPVYRPPPTPTPGPLHHHDYRRGITKYQEYIEKMLDLLKERVEPREEPPLVVVAPKRRKKKKKAKKYCLASMEDSGPFYVVKAPQPEEEDEDERPAIIIKHRTNKCCLCRPCIKTCCKTVLADDCDCEED